MHWLPFKKRLQVHPIFEKMLRCFRMCSRTNENELTNHCMSCNFDLHLETNCFDLSSVAKKDIKQLELFVLLLCKKCIEAVERERLLGSTMAKSIEESVQSLNLDRKLEKIKQKLTRVVDNGIQVSVSEAIQKKLIGVKKMLLWNVPRHHRMICQVQAKKSQARPLIAPFNQALECKRFSRMQRSQGVRILCQRKKSWEKSWTLLKLAQKFRIATTGKI